MEQDVKGRRPPVDVVVPFAGEERQLHALLRRLRALSLASGDTLTVVDNRLAEHGPVAAVSEGPRLVRASERPSSYYARNRGAEGGGAPWLLFLDADVEAPQDLLNRYFSRAPSSAAALLAGGVRDAPLPAGIKAPLAARFAVAREAMSQNSTMTSGRWAYAQTANCLVRRAAFEDVGGFEESIRSGGDADLCFRLRDSGWAFERREEASVVHENRETVRGLLRQWARHGSGAAWLNRRYPGSFPSRSPIWLALWAVRQAAMSVRELAAGNGEHAVLRMVDVGAVAAFEVGRWMPNRVPLR